MTDNSTYNHTPALRFPDFLNDGEWEVKRLGEIAEKVTSKNKSNEQLPVLTNSATEGVVNQQDYFDREIVTRENLTNYHIIELNDFVYNPRVSVAAPVGPISRNKIGIGIMSPLYTIFKFKEGNIDFFEQYFRTNCWHQYLKDKANFGARFDRMNISNEDFFNLPIPFPPLAEQRRIAACLSALDEMLAATNGKLEQLKAYKKGLMQNLFVSSMWGGGKSLNINYLQITKLRFPEFYDEKEWEEKKLGECFSERTERNYNDLPLLSLTESDGIVLQEETNRKNNSNADKSKYLRVCIGDIAYNTMRMWQGRCAIVNIEGIVSPAYTICKPKQEMDSLFFYYYFKTNDAIEKFHRNSQGLVNDTLNLKYESFEKIKMFVPSLSEQHKIASCLSSMDETINAYTEKAGLLGQYKKGLMQGMFPPNQMN